MIALDQDSDMRGQFCEFVSYFSIKIYVMGAQKNRLNKTVLLSTHIMI